MNTKTESLNNFRILSLNDIGRPRVHKVTRKRPQPHLAGAAICRRICICCGEPMVEGGNSLSRNPNVCASCSSLSDGMEHAQHPVGKDDRQTGVAVPIFYKPNSSIRLS
jgi:hypothetical protein